MLIQGVRVILNYLSESFSAIPVNPILNPFVSKVVTITIVKELIGIIAIAVSS